MRRMNHRLSVVLELFPIPPWTEQLAKRQFLFAAKIASEQSWSSIAGHWTSTTGWQANFDNMPFRKRGRPLVRWDDKLPKITEQYFPPHYRWFTAAKCHHGKMLGTISFHILWASRFSFSPCPYGIVVVVFHFDSGGRKAKVQTQNVNLQTAHHVSQHQFANSTPLPGSRDDHFVTHHVVHYVTFRKNCQTPVLNNLHMVHMLQ